MDLVVEDASGDAVAVTRDFAIDAQWGDGACSACDFELSETPVRLGAGWRAYVDGTDIGGVVDSVEAKRSGGVESLSYKGRTWYGVLDGKVLCPDEGEDRVVLGGSVPSVISSLLGLCGVGAPFFAGTGSGTVPSTAFPRYCTCYEALRIACRAAGMRLGLAAVPTTSGGISRGVRVGGVPVEDWGEEVGRGAVDYKASRAYRPVNHIIALGKGELRDRLVVHVYADGKGAVSQKRTFSGIDERAQVYELSSEGDSAKLLDKAVEKLESLQPADEVDADLGERAGVAVGDRVTLRVDSYGFETSAEITGVVVKAKGGSVSVTPQTGTAEIPKDEV